LSDVLTSRGIDPITASTIVQLRDMARVYFANNRRKLATLDAWLTEQIIGQRKVEAGTTATTPEHRSVVVVFRPAGDAWQLGFEHAPVIVPYPHNSRPLQAAHAAIASGRAISIVPFVDERSRHPENALRNALRTRVVPWIREHTGCGPLADAIRSIQVTRDRQLRYEPTCKAPVIRV